VHTEFWSENLNGTNHVEDINMNGRELGWLSMNMIRFAQGRGKQEAAVNSVMNLQIL
jgi:hypothetical protein